MKTASRQTTKSPINNLQGVFVFVHSQKMIQNNSFTHACAHFFFFLMLFFLLEQRFSDPADITAARGDNRRAADSEGRGNLFCRLTIKGLFLSSTLEVRRERGRGVHYKLR